MNKCKNCGGEFTKLIHRNLWTAGVCSPYCQAIEDKKFRDSCTNPEPITNPITADLQPNEERLYTAIAIAQKKIR